VNIGNKNILSGEELKKLLIKNSLPQEYINAENLKTLLEYEFEQMGDDEYYDTKIIEYCSDWLSKNYTDKNYEQRKRETFKKIKSQIKARDKIKRPLSFKIIRIAAVFIAVLVSVQIISITVFSFNFFDWTKNTFLTLIGVEVNQDDISSLSSHSREYKTIEEFESVENIDIIVPTWLPGDIGIKFVSYAYDFEEKEVAIHYNDDITLLVIKLNSPIPITDGTEIYENNNILFYIFTEANLILWEHDGNFYNLNCGFDISEYAEKIIENIK